MTSTTNLNALGLRLTMAPGAGGGAQETPASVEPNLSFFGHVTARSEPGGGAQGTPASVEPDLSLFGNVTTRFEPGGAASATANSGAGSVFAAGGAVRAPWRIGTSPVEDAVLSAVRRIREPDVEFLKKLPRLDEVDAKLVDNMINNLAEIADQVAPSSNTLFPEFLASFIIRVTKNEDVIFRFVNKAVELRDDCLRGRGMANHIKTYKQLDEDRLNAKFNIDEDYTPGPTALGLAMRQIIISTPASAAVSIWEDGIESPVSAAVSIREDEIESLAQFARKHFPNAFLSYVVRFFKAATNGHGFTQFINHYRSDSNFQDLGTFVKYVLQCNHEYLPIYSREKTLAQFIHAVRPRATLEDLCNFFAYTVPVLTQRDLESLRTVIADNPHKLSREINLYLNHFTDWFCFFMLMKRPDLLVGGMHMGGREERFKIALEKHAAVHDLALLKGELLRAIDKDDPLYV